MIVSKPPDYYPIEVHNKIISELYSGVLELTYTALYRRIKDVATSHGIKLGINKAKAFAKYYYSTLQLIQQHDNGLYVLKLV